MTKNKDYIGFGTKAIHAGNEPEVITGAIMPPIFLTSTYIQDGPGAHKGFEYSRTHNPTRFALEKNLAVLERAAHGFAFASGSSATAAVIQLLSAGDHVIAGDDLYGGTVRLFEKVFARQGLSFSYFDPTEGGAGVNKLIRPETKLVWIESPTNPMLKLCDIEAVAKVCHKHDVLLCVDNTFMTPYFQQPLTLGADIVCHSVTKYLSGHSDVIAGALMTNDDALAEQIRFIQNAVGAVPSPIDSFLVLRGTKTLHVRMQRHEENAQALAQWLEEQSFVEQVIYPGLSSHPQHTLASRQQGGFGGMIGCYIRGDLGYVSRALKACRVFACAESLGGVESLIQHPATMTHASLDPIQRRSLGMGDNFIRLSVGIEFIDDLYADLLHAFNVAA